MTQLVFPRVVDEPVAALERLIECLAEAGQSLALAHPALEEGDACLDDEQVLTRIAFGILPLLVDLDECAVRYRHAALR